MSSKPSVPDFDSPQTTGSAAVPAKKQRKAKPTGEQPSRAEQSVFLDVMRYLDASEDSMAEAPAKPAAPTSTGARSSKKRGPELLTSSQREHNRHREDLPMLYCGLDLSTDSPTSTDSCASVDFATQSTATPATASPSVEDHVPPDTPNAKPAAPPQRHHAPRLTWDRASPSHSQESSHTANGINELIERSVFTHEKTKPREKDAVEQQPFKSLWSQVKESADAH